MFVELAVDMGFNASDGYDNEIYIYGRHYE
jgi:hypothetical protein